MPTPKKPVHVSEEFVFEVGKPSVSYHFALERDQHVDDPFEEGLLLEFKGTCLHPDRFKDREVDIRVYGKRDLVEEVRNERPETPPNGVASIVATKTKFDVWAYLPSDACWQVGAAISSGSIRWFLANVPVFTPKHSFINSISFQGPEFDAIGYVG